MSYLKRKARFSLWKVQSLKNLFYVFKTALREITVGTPRGKKKYGVPVWSDWPVIGDIFFFSGGRTGDEERVDDDNNHCIKRSSSLEALADMCSSVFDRVSDVQKALIILLFVGLVVYVVTEFLSGACGTIRAIGDMWNNLYILRCGPPPI